MEWVKLIATPPYYIDPALLRAGEAAELLFCRGLAYCGSVESRGVIDKTVLPMLCPRPAPRAAALVREKLWMDKGDHYLVRSWDKWQDEHDAAAERRRKDRERKRESRRTTRDMSADSPRDVSAPTAECRALDVEVDVEKDKETPKTSPSSLRDDALPEGFEAFWDEYPRRVGKQDAIKAYRKALKKTDPVTLLAGAMVYRNDPNREQEFTAHPATWLNRGGWDDDPLPARGLRAVPTRVQEQDALLRRWHDEALNGQMPELGA